MFLAFAIMYNQSNVGVPISCTAIPRLSSIFDFSSVLWSLTRRKSEVLLYNVIDFDGEDDWDCGVVGSGGWLPAFRRNHFRVG